MISIGDSSEQSCAAILSKSMFLSKRAKKQRNNVVDEGVSGQDEVTTGARSTASRRTSKVYEGRGRFGRDLLVSCSYTRKVLHLHFPYRTCGASRLGVRVPRRGRGKDKV